MEAQARARLYGPPKRYRIDDDVYRLTGDWRPLVDHLAAEEWQIPLLLDLTQADDAEDLRCRLADRDDGLRARDLYRIAERVVQAATGQPWWVVRQLLVGAMSGKVLDVDGGLLREGVDLAELIRTDPAKACSVVYSWATAGAEEKEVVKYDAKTFRPPREVVEAQADAEEDEEQDDAARQAAEEESRLEGQAFMAAMAQGKKAGYIRQDARES